MSFVSVADTLQDAWIELNGKEEFVGDSLTFLDVSDRESDVRNFKKMHISNCHQPTGCPERADLLITVNRTALSDTNRLKRMTRSVN